MYRLLTHSIIAMTLSGFSALAQANFDFCSNSGNGGSDSFQRNIGLSQIITIGELPTGISGIDIRLRASADLDVQLYDKQTGTKIVGWPDGRLNSSNRRTTQYQGMSITWSGYNGDGSGFGNEYITISGQTTRALLMKAFGYKAGNATVNYSWTGGSAGCQVPTSGGGVFRQSIVEDAVVTVGDIPPGVTNLYIKLESDQDIDIQLFDTANNYPIVEYPDGQINGPRLQRTNYQGMSIEWSGYTGVNSKSGHEYIKIAGTTTRTLTLKAFGFQSGYAFVEYSWGNGNNPPVNNDPLNLRPGDDGATLRLSNGNNRVATTCTFRDVSSNQWHTDYINALCSAGIVVGYYTSSGPEYRPFQEATMAEALKVINYASAYHQTQQACEGTETSGNWYQCHLDIANSHGVLPWQSSNAASTHLTRGDLFIYTAKAFFGVATSSPRQAFNVLKSRGILEKDDLYRWLNRAELAVVAVRAAEVTNKRLPYGLVPQPYPLQYKANLPDSSTPLPIQNPSSGLGQKVLSKARQEIGEVGYPWTSSQYTYCARFVRMMFDKPASGHAYQMCGRFQNRGLLNISGTAPAGSVICYPRSTPGSGGYGHIAIATGNGNEIGVTSLTKGVTEREIQPNNIGWVSPEVFRDRY